MARYASPRRYREQKLCALRPTPTQPLSSLIQYTHRRNYDAYLYVKYVNGGRAPRGLFEVFGDWVESAFDSVMGAFGFASGGGARTEGGKVQAED